MSLLLRSGFLVLLIASNASAQDYSILGTWQNTSMGPPRSVTTVVYAPDGETMSETAIAPQPGQAGGVIRTAGHYQMQGPTALRIIFGQSEMCAAGSACGPAPQHLVPFPGSAATLDFSMRGNDQIVGADGRVWVRIR